MARPAPGAIKIEVVDFDSDFDCDSDSDFEETNSERLNCITGYIGLRLTIQPAPYS